MAKPPKHKAVKNRTLYRGFLLFSHTSAKWVAQAAPVLESCQYYTCQVELAAAALELQSKRAFKAATRLLWCHLLLPRSLSVLVKFWARSSGGKGSACHFHFSTIQGVMRKKKWSILGTDSFSTCCSLSNLVMLAALWDRLHLAYGFLRKKNRQTLSLLFSSLASSGERCSAGRSLEFSVKNPPAEE